MRIQFFGYNYEGARFRGFDSNTDEVPVTGILDGSSLNIVTFLRENMSYGQDADFPIETIDELCEHLKNGNEPVFDGCGAILKLVQKNKLLDDVVHLDIIHEYCQDENPEWIDLGVIHLEPKSLNDLVREKVNGSSDRVIS